MTSKEIRDKSNDHLQQELSEQQKHMFELRTQAVTEKLEDPSQLGKTRKSIARIRTILRQRNIEHEKMAKAGSVPAGPGHVVV